MLKKNIDTYGLLLFSIICTVLGFLTIFNGKLILRYNIYLLAVIIALYTLFDFAKIFFDKNNNKSIMQGIIKVVFDYTFAMIIIYNTDLILAGITIIFGFYILVHSILHLINFILYRINNIKGALKLLLYFIVTFVLAVILIFSPNRNIFYGELIIGLYFIFLGIAKLDDFIIEITPTKISNKLKSHIQIQLPILFAMFIPKQLISLINENLEIREEPEEFDVKKMEKIPDIEVIVHLATSGSASFGHVEVCYQNKIYSFGNYDRHSRYLFDAIGDGVICIADRNKYIDYVLTKKNRYLVVFGIKLTDKEKIIIEKRIDKLINENTTDYYPDLELYEQGIIPKADFNDMSSDIYRLANGKFKKITSGKNKKFFVLKTNCVMVANTILNGIEGNLIAINGIISPGSYYDYLNNAFLRKNSKVITRKVYTRKSIENQFL